LPARFDIIHSAFARLPQKNSLHDLVCKAKMNDPPDKNLPDFEVATLPDSPDLKCPHRGLIADVIHLFKLSQPDMHAA
jgi:hypothetical protein